MLVLSRKIGEKILVGDNIQVTILEARGNRIRVGIEAPRNVRIQREEVIIDMTECPTPLPPTKKSKKFLSPIPTFSMNRICRIRSVRPKISLHCAMGFCFAFSC